MKDFNVTAKELYDQAHKHLFYDPETGIFTCKYSNSRRIVGEKLGVMTTGGYRRIYLKPYVYNDAVLAYLMITGELHRYIGRYNKNVTDCKFDNLYVSETRIINNLIFPQYTKLHLAQAIEANPIKIGKLAVRLKTVPQNIRPFLKGMVLDNYLKIDENKVYSLTAIGHREVMIRGNFGISDRNVPGFQFQMALPGTLTGNEGPKVLKKELR